MEASAGSLAVHARVLTAARAPAMPWQLAAVVFATTSVIIGLIWDISWHMTIGRDTFWTPAHLAIYTGGAVAGIACGYEVLRRSFFARGANRDGVTIWRVFNGSLGGWLCIWGATAMLTSGPFDDWWHNAYGLDVKIISPPHALLALGFIAILAGALVMALVEQSRSTRVDEAGHERAHIDATPGAAWLVAYASGLVLTLLAIFSSEYYDRVRMHSGSFYAVAALVFPFALVSAGLAVRLRYPATATALIYTLVMCAQVWILPLFAATPKLGPIRQVVTHMVPLSFPLLLIVPAVALDLLLRRTERRGAWMRALLLGVAFVVIFAVVQWPFADFLMSPAARNAVFRPDNFAYMVPADWLGPLNKFMPEPVSVTLRGFAIALALSVLSARAGLGWGNWLRSVRR